MTSHQEVAKQRFFVQLWTDSIGVISLISDMEERCLNSWASFTFFFHCVSGEVKTLLRQLLSGVNHLHDNWIIHRDLKTSNLLLSHKGILKVYILELRIWVCYQKSIFFFPAETYFLGTLKPSHRDGSFEYPKQMFKLVNNIYYIPINDTSIELFIFWPSDTESQINKLRFSKSLSFKTRLTLVTCFGGDFALSKFQAWN